MLGVSVSLSEAEVHWRALLKDLVERGLQGVRMITSDDHAGLKAALRATFSGVAWQRCQFHLQQNAGSYLPRVDQRADAARDIRAIFNAPDQSEAERLLGKAVSAWTEPAPRLAAWMAENLREGWLMKSRYSVSSRISRSTWRSVTGTGGWHSIHRRTKR